jgi:hypothetical protein
MIVYCQCKKCLDLFDLELVVKGKEVVEFYPTSHVTKIDGHLRHHCGGDIVGIKWWPPVSFNLLKETKVKHGN